MIVTKVLKPKFSKIVQMVNNKERVGSDPDSRRSETQVKKLSKIALTTCDLRMKPRVMVP